MPKKPRIVKPGEEAEPVVPSFHLVDFSDSPTYKTFQKASSKLADLQGGFQRFVVMAGEGRYVPVAMLLPTECTPDIIDAVRRYGCHAMVGLASEHLIIERRR